MGSWSTAPNPHPGPGLLLRTCFTTLGRERRQAGKWEKMRSGFRAQSGLYPGKGRSEPPRPLPPTRSRGSTTLRSSREGQTQG